MIYDYIFLLDECSCCNIKAHMHNNFFDDKVFCAVNILRLFKES